MSIEPRQQAIDELYAYLRAQQAGAKATTEPSANGAGQSPELDDDALLQRALAAKNGAKVARLWSGDTSAHPSHSEADLSLCREFAYWTQDPEQLDRLFRRSRLMRDKWERADYRDTTIAKAIASAREHWRGVSAEPENGEPQDGVGEPEPEPEEEHHASGNGDETPESVPVHLTDRGNALRLVKAHGQDLHYIYRWKKWLIWDGTRWKVDEGNLIERLAKQVITQLYLEAKAIVDQLSQDSGREDMGEAARKTRDQKIAIAMLTLKWALKSESAERLSGMLRHARSERGIAITPDQLDANPWILNCRNGTIDLKTGKLRRHHRDDLCTKRIDVDYHPRARCKKVMAFLYRIMGKPKPDAKGLTQELRERRQRARRLVKFIQRSVGYSLTGITQEAVLFFMYGTGDNGKSTFSETIAALLRPYFQKAPQELLMRKERRNVGGPSPEIARLFGARLVIASEVSEHHRLNESQVKDLTGDDTLTARGLYEAFFDFRPTHKLWMYGNHKPTILGTDHAIWKRPKLIPFTEKIPKSEQIKGFREKYLMPELSGLLAWAVRGCLSWQKSGLQVPEEVEIATQEYRREMDLLSAFIDDHCLRGANYTVRGAELHKAYLDSIDNDKEAYLTQRQFYRRLREHGFTSYLGHGNATFWRGVGLKASPDADPGAGSSQG
jgi:putative DNA primase/helicase